MSRPRQTLASPDPRATFEFLTAEILQLKGRAARNLYAIGVRLTRVRDEELWRHGGYDGFDGYLEGEVELSRTTAYDLIRIARHFNAQIAARYGYDKLRAVMVYISATPDDELPGDVFSAQIRLRDDEGRFFSKSLNEATAGEVRRAIVLLGDARSGRGSIPRALRTRIKRLEKALPAAPRGTRAGPRIRLRRGKDGKVALSFQAIPLDELESFIETLRRWL